MARAQGVGGGGAEEGGAGRAGGGMGRKGGGGGFCNALLISFLNEQLNKNVFLDQGPRLNFRNREGLVLHILIYCIWPCMHEHC